MGSEMCIRDRFFVDRRASMTPTIALCAVALAVGPGAVLLLPGQTAALLWVVSAGVGTSLLPAVITLVSMRASTVAGRVSLSGFVQFIGFSMGALGPVVVGVLHSITWSWVPPLAFLAASPLMAVAALVWLRDTRTYEETAG